MSKVYLLGLEAPLAKDIMWGVKNRRIKVGNNFLDKLLARSRADNLACNLTVFLDGIPHKDLDRTAERFTISDPKDHELLLAAVNAELLNREGEDYVDSSVKESN